MGNQQNRHPFRKTDRLPARLPRIVGTVLLEKSAGVFENVHGVFEADAVFPLVASRLHGTPLEPGHPNPSIAPNL